MDQPDWQRHIEWITVMSQNIMAAANDLRPVQVRPSNLSLIYGLQWTSRLEVISSQ